MWQLNGMLEVYMYVKALKSWPWQKFRVHLQTILWTVWNDDIVKLRLIFLWIEWLRFMWKCFEYNKLGCYKVAW